MSGEELRREALSDDRAWNSGYLAGRAAARKEVAPSTPEPSEHRAEWADDMPTGWCECGLPFQHRAETRLRAAPSTEPALCGVLARCGRPKGHRGPKGHHGGWRVVTEVSRE